MKKRFRNLALATTLFLGGCCKERPQFVTQGYVRSMWCHESQCSIVIECENGAMFTLRTYLVPPVWVGLHARIHYHPDEDWGGFYDVEYIERLP
jgi:hypothetical protein